MADKTGIAWTDATWNPVRGCSRVSEGCRNCYAERAAARFSNEEESYESGGPQGWVQTRRAGPYYGFATSKGWTGKVALVRGKLDQPLRWTKPRRIFVNSMSDLFHERLSDEEVAAVFGVMAAAPRHTFQVLTKRPERMRRWFEWLDALDDGPFGAPAHVDLLYRFGALLLPTLPAAPRIDWPLPNVWLGVSAEDQKAADERIPLLLQTPAAVRFVSAEPLLGPLDLLPFLHLSKMAWKCWPCGYATNREEPLCPNCGKALDPDRRIDWVIVGGESGPGARPCNVEWVRSIVRQCREAGVACFVKQLGARPTVSHPVYPGDPHYNQHFPFPLRDRKGGDPSEWFEDLRVREFPRGGV